MRRIAFLAVVAVAASIGPQAAFSQKAGAPAKPLVKKGRYSGATKQTDVLKDQRGIAFQVKGRKISLTTEPVIARGFCFSTPVFLLDTDEVTTKISKGGRFSFQATFIGTKIDRIEGAFDAKGNIAGTILYHFPTSDTGACTGGKTETTFTAKKRKK